MNCTFAQSDNQLDGSSIHFKAKKAGLWFSLPKAGECLANETVGIDCHWRVVSLDKVISVECLRMHGCGRRNCSAAIVTEAVGECPDVRYTSRDKA